MCDREFTPRLKTDLRRKRDDRPTAVSQAAEWRAAWIEDHEAEHEAVAVITVGRVLALYAADAGQRTRWDKEHARLRVLEAELGADTPVETLTVAGITAWRDRLRTEGRDQRGRRGRRRKPLAARSVNAYLILLQAAMNYAVKAGLLEHNHLRHVRKLPEEYGLPEALTMVQLEALWTALDAWEAEAGARVARAEAGTNTRADGAPPQVPLRGLILVAYYTMARTANVLGLTWEQVHFTDGEIHFPTTKNRRYVVLPMDEPLRRYLLRLCPGPGATGLIHPNRSGAAWVNIHDQWRRLLVLANAELQVGQKISGAFRFYGLRHTRATDLADAGVPAKVIAEWMGDTSIATVEKHYFGRHRRLSAHHWLDVANRHQQALRARLRDQEARETRGEANVGHSGAIFPDR